MADEIEWLSCEESDLVGHVYDLAMPIHLGNYDYDELLKLAPDRAYVVDVEFRLARLVNRFETLNIVYKMLAVEQLPMQTAIGAIRREEWIRITLDVLLSRLTSIRDCAMLLVVEIFEAGIEPRQVSLKRIKDNPNIPNNPFASVLTDIANVGKGLRDERDRHMHRGEERGLGEDPTTYKAASIFEAIGQPVQGTDRFGIPIDLEGYHRQLAEDIKNEFTNVAQHLESKVIELFDELYPYFLQSFRVKRQLSQLD